MYELILSLLLALGINLNPKGATKSIIVIDQSTGISYGVGTSNGVGNSVTTSSTNTEVYYLVKDANGRYQLIKK